MEATPSDAPEHCPGTESEDAGKASACAGCPNQKICASGEQNAFDPDAEAILERLSTVGKKVLILSGKGGVGKSTLTSMLARACAKDESREIGVLDVDICGPSQPRLLGVLTETVHSSGSGWSPVFVGDNLSLMSIGFLLNSPQDAVIWRGPKKNGLIKQFLKDVDWGPLDYLFIDTPPGTSDEHLTIIQYLSRASDTAAIIVTTPQEVSLLDVRKEITFCNRVKIPIIGIVENMTSFICPKCKVESTIFPPTTGGAAALAAEFNLPLLARIPLEPQLAKACDEGTNVDDQSVSSAIYLSIIQKINEYFSQSGSS